MPRFDLRYRPAAFAELEDIFRGVVRVSASPVTAQRYVARIPPTLPAHHLTLAAARRAPARRPRAPALRAASRSDSVLTIIYRVIGETVEITNVFPWRPATTLRLTAEGR